MAPQPTLSRQGSKVSTRVRNASKRGSSKESASMKRRGLLQDDDINSGGSSVGSGDLVLDSEDERMKISNGNETESGRQVVDDTLTESQREATALAAPPRKSFRDFVVPEDWQFDETLGKTDEEIAAMIEEEKKWKEATAAAVKDAVKQVPRARQIEDKVRMRPDESDDCGMSKVKNFLNSCTARCITIDSLKDEVLKEHKYLMYMQQEADRWFETKVEARIADAIAEATVALKGLEKFRALLGSDIEQQMQANKECIEEATKIRNMGQKLLDDVDEIRKYIVEIHEDTDRLVRDYQRNCVERKERMMQRGEELVVRSNGVLEKLTQIRAKDKQVLDAEVYGAIYKKAPKSARRSLVMMMPEEIAYAVVPQQILAGMNYASLMARSASNSKDHMINRAEFNRTVTNASTGSAVPSPNEARRPGAYDVETGGAQVIAERDAAQSIYGGEVKEGETDSNLPTMRKPETEADLTGKAVYPTGEKLTSTGDRIDLSSAETLMQEGKSALGASMKKSGASKSAAGGEGGASMREGSNPPTKFPANEATANGSGSGSSTANGKSLNKSSSQESGKTMNKSGTNGLLKKDEAIEALVADENGDA